jgi:hypothetical protein
VKELRASSLPKLAECPLFEGASGEASPAAARGTKLDIAYREMILGVSHPLDALEEDEKAAVMWAVNESETLASGCHIETREEYLAMAVPGLSTVGTADALCIGDSWLADLKTGQVRNYREQMAGYALACMNDHFTESWTAHVLYCDQGVRRSYDFTYTDAQAIVAATIAEATSKDAEPNPCEYCGWCARKDTCKAIVHANSEAIALCTSSESLTSLRDRIMASPETVAEFARQWKQAEKDIAEPVLERLKELAALEQAPGWRLIQVTGREYAETPAIAAVANETRISAESLILAMGGKMSGKQFREWTSNLGVVLDESAIKRGEPTTQLRQEKKKKN